MKLFDTPKVSEPGAEKIELLMAAFKLAVPFSIALGIVFRFVLSLPVWQCLLLVSIGCFGMIGFRRVYLFFKNVPRDVK